MLRHNSLAFTFICVNVFAILFFIMSWGILSDFIIQPGLSTKRDEAFDFDGILTIKRGMELANSMIATPAVTAPRKDEKKVSSTPEAETPMPPLDIKSFKKLPIWDFEEVYNQDAPPRHTSCAQTPRNSQDESFKKTFLPNIRLYLHKDNFNMSEWNRLSHFNSPFGFMGFQYKDVIEAVKLIPVPKEPLFTPKPGGDGCVRCAVVGTGGILKGSKMGKEIDNHDFVFRMNTALTKGHEEDVGNRTSVYIHTAHAITSSKYFYKKYGYKPVPADEDIKYMMIPAKMRDYQWLTGLLKRETVSDGPYRNRRPWTYYGGQFDEKRFYVLHPDFLRYVRNSFLKSHKLNAKSWPIVRPTSGAFAVFMALHTCDIERIVDGAGNRMRDRVQPVDKEATGWTQNQVSAYGFMTKDYKLYSNYYYESSQTHVIFYSNHDYHLEKDTWKKLHDAKVIKLYQRTESGTEEPKKP